jgi:hypothetical protein
MKTNQPKYRIELSCINFIAKKKEIHSYAYSVKEQGKPTSENAKLFRNGMNKSLSKGGTNEHLRNMQGDYSNAYIIEQKTGQQIAEYIAPMFETI